jgi:hypothetical protein
MRVKFDRPGAGEQHVRDIRRASVLAYWKCHGGQS